MPSIEVELTVACEKCGGSLDATAETKSYGRFEVSVTPCETCLEKAKDAGDDEGYARGIADERAENETTPE